MAVPISNVTRRAVYAPSGAGGVGPYAFTFEILANTDIAVYKEDTLLTLTTHYTVSISSNGTGSVTITAAGLALAPVSPTQYAIVGNRTISRSTDFTTGGDFFANTINDELDQQTIFAQQNAEGLTRSLQAPQTDPTTIDMTLPRASVRANKTLAFDSNGDPTTGEVIGDNRGNWSASVAYNKRDIVKDTSNGNIYYANTSHTSSGAQPISTNTDSAKWDLIVDNASAGSSATAAAASASAASTSASNASTSASNASTSATNAASSASSASTQATNASNSATAAASSASSASSSASAASGSASTASTQASNASTSASNASTSASGASTSATNAAASASTATTQASNASTSATNAANSASAASTSASNAATSASNASASETAAAASAASAAASFDAFDDIYLGAKASDPSVDNDGNALTTGDQYFNTTANELRVYNGSTWQAASTVGGTVTNLTVTNGATIQGLTVGLGAGAVSTNTAVGASALAANQAGGTNNTAIGNAALDANTTGDENTAVGSDALGASTTANRNTALGYQAGYATTTGGINVFVGSYAGNNNNGTQNVAVGDSALQTSGVSTNNIAIGYSSLTANTSGGSNVAIGTQALASNTTASNNTAVGYQAGYSNVAGGAGAGKNTFVGNEAGYAATGYRNVFYGYRSGYLVTTGNSNTIVGNYDGNTVIDIRTSDNYIVLSDGDGNPRVFYAYVSASVGTLNVYSHTTANSTNSTFQVRNATGFDVICEAGNYTSTAISGVIRVAKVASNNRSINAAGTVNQNGADYAEYMVKSGSFTIAKGDVCGINAEGKLTNVFADAISFCVKSTDPGLVGGDSWFTEPRPKDENNNELISDTQEYAAWFVRMEAARATVDRIAFCGQVPVNVLGATSGQYIIPVNDNGAIKGEAVSNPTFEQYQMAVGKVIAIESDGRAKIIVKVA